MAGPEGIPAGQEVTISYGSHWPNEAFLLLFGFAPDGNPSDGVVIFPRLSNLAEAWLRHRQISGRPGDAGGVSTLNESNAIDLQVEIALLHPELAETAGSGDYDRLLVTEQGIDSRMGDALALVSRASKEAKIVSIGEDHETGRMVSAAEQRAFLLAECLTYRDKLEHAALKVGLAAIPHAALQYRSQKLRIIKQVIKGLSS